MTCSITLQDEKENEAGIFCVLFMHIKQLFPHFRLFIENENLYSFLLASASSLVHMELEYFTQTNIS